MADTRKQVTRIGKASSAALLQERRNEMAVKAYTMRKSGKSWYEIGNELGLAHTDAKRLADEVIRAAADLVDVGTKQELLHMEVARLDDLQAAFYRDAMMGDVDAARFVLTVIKERARLQRLDVDDSALTSVTAVVVPASSEEYAEALRMIAAGGRSDHGDH